MEATKMHLVYFSNEFPRHDLQTLFRRVHHHSKDKQLTTLAHFIDEATWVVKDEVRRLPTELKKLVGPFETLLSWAENTDLREGLISGAVDGVLLIVAQIATYIVYAQQHPQALNNAEHTSLAGLGIGLLASTAVSLSSTVADLVHTGANAVRLAFRMGIHVQGVSENLETRDLTEAPETWAYVIHNIESATAQKELDTMHSEEQIPDTGKIFISAVSRTSVTVSGPPSRLKALFNKSQLFRDARSIPLPVYGGLCHAPHIFNEQDTRTIVSGAASLQTIDAGSSMMKPVYSTSTGLPYAVSNGLELYSCVISELLTQAICWDNVVANLVVKAQGYATSGAVLHCFGNSIPLMDLNTALKDNVSGLKVAIHDIMPSVMEDQASIRPRGTAQSKLAIVGMSCRLPGGATDQQKFWNILEQGLDVSRPIPADRFDLATHYDPTGTDLNKSATQYMCAIDEPGLFDAPFFNMSPREAQTVDPQMRLALVTAYEALEQSGYVGNRTASTQLQRIGTYYGQAADDYREVNQGQEVSTYYIPGGCRAFGPGRINYFFKFAGPSYSIDTACSSGLAAVEIACKALWDGSVDTAITGGVNVLTNPDGFSGLCSGHFLTKGHNACKTWDATADGYCRADGIVSLVIKRLEDAEADNDRILGTVLGAGTNHSANAVSITHPHAGHQADLAREVLRQAAVDPLDVSYIELHGTGTQAGDSEEMKGVMDVYAPLTKRRSKDQPLYIGAVKANVGHGESVAGTTALLKTILMMQRNAIPRHIGIKTEINPKFPKDFDKRNLHIAFEQTPWLKAIDRKRIAVVNSFGAAGGNTTLLLEDAPTRIHTQTDPRLNHVVAVSAKTKGSLTGNIERLVAHLDAHPEVSLADLGYTTTARRYQHSYRVAIAATDMATVKKQLISRLDKLDSLKPVGKAVPPPIAFTFTGQGASYKSMSLELYRDAPVFREHMQHLDHLAQGQGFPSIIPAVDGSHGKDHSHAPVVTQLALVCTEMALVKYWSSLGIKPDLVYGHSLGEYAALFTAGVLSASDTIFLVGRRALLLQEKCKIGSHTMMAVRASLEQIAESAAGRPYTIACINGRTDTVLSGTTAEMDGVAAPLEAAGYRTIKLDVAYAFHSAQTDPILDDFEAIARSGVIFNEPKMPVVSPLLGKCIFDAKTFNANYLRRATREPVDFLGGLEHAQKISTVNDETIWVEIGPHPVCTGFIKSISSSVALAVPSIRRGDDNWKTMAESMAALHLAGLGVSWNEFHAPFESRLNLLDLPTYAFNDKNHWLQYTGDWCLTKGNSYYIADKDAAKARTLPKLPIASDIQTSTVHQVIEDISDGSAYTVAIQSDLQQPDLLSAANGHRMNNCGVVTSSIHADIAYTLGGYLYRKWSPKAKDVPINVANLVVTYASSSLSVETFADSLSIFTRKGLVAQSKNTPQLFRVTATTVGCAPGVADLSWQNVESDGTVQEPFATANIIYGDAAEWLSSWAPMAHLIHGRIDTLERLAAEGVASRFSHNMAYTLFASNLVNYAEKYRGMQSVVMHELEAVANVELTTKESGVWTVPPYFIDSVAHLAGFVMNCSDAMDTTNDFCVTPGWTSMRFGKPLVAGARYRSYVKMIPTAEDPQIYLGDVYIMQDTTIVGMVGGIKFRRYPRVLLERFFSPPDKMATIIENKLKTPATPAPVRAELKAPPPALSDVQATPAPHHEPLPTNIPSARPGPPKNAKAEVVKAVVASAAEPAAADTVTAKALQLVANEAGLELSDLENDATFADLGVDSLMSLVISEKFRSHLDVKVGGSLFLDYPTIGDLRTWLDESYS
ncbi:Non-reducing polyketide synthase PKS8-1 [Elasticomyces elasticus]|nr:Non-reducing polyketide synthase PKS8-1 [Elasticomyces elasticus]KAK3630984.1 Non-reducing polyketide synthase PKS8-1 [Elasticomyces elasticus]KAK4908797.1 Non-reducing polyketide synthase PKS8-1 [Elasticomyces elasticus]KAK5748799.1 Non-reducing polyketide synthase PKS8-1 [Elasticomyces elasticus]